MVYLHNFYLNPMFDPSGPRPGADAHNCTVGYVSEYKPPSLYPGVNLTTINDGDGFAQIPHPGLPRETPLVLAANTYADEGGRPLYGSWLECWGYDRSGTWRPLGSTNGGMGAEFTIPGERKEPPQIVFRAPGKAGQRINMWCIFVGAKADYEEFQLLAPGSPFAGNLMPLPLGGGAGLNAVVWLFALTALTGWWPHDVCTQLHDMRTLRLVGQYHGVASRHAQPRGHSGGWTGRSLRPMDGNSDTRAGSMGDSRPLPAGYAPRIGGAKPAQRRSAGLERKLRPNVEQRSSRSGGEELRLRVHGARGHGNSDVASVRPIGHGRFRDMGSPVPRSENRLAAAQGAGSRLVSRRHDANALDFGLGVAA